MKRVTKKVIVAAALVLALVGCGSKGDSKKKSDSDVVEINFFHRWPNEPRNTYFAEKAKEFEKQKDGKVKIKIDTVLNDSYKEKIKVLISNNDLPDIFTSWSDSFATNLVSSGKIMPLDSIVNEDTAWSDKIMDSQLGGFTVDDNLYGIPLTIDGKAFFYNKEAFEKNNLAVPTTYGELITALKTLQKAGYKTPIIEGLSDQWTISHYLGTIFERLIDKETLNQDYNPDSGKFTDQRYVKGLEMFQELASYMGDTATAIDHETARNMFASGEVPVVYLQFAEIKMIEDAGKIDFGYFDFPSVENGDGDQKSLTGAPEGFMLSKDAPKEAVEFLEFLTSSESAYEFTKKDGQLTAIEGGVKEDNVSKASYDAYQLILKASTTAPWFDNAVDLGIADIFMKGGQSIAIGEESPKDVMKDVQEAASALRK